MSALPAGAPAWATSIWNGLQGLDTQVTALTQGVNTASNAATTAADEAKQTKSAVTSSADSSGWQQYIWIGVIALVAWFFLRKG